MGPNGKRTMLLAPLNQIALGYPACYRLVVRGFAAEGPPAARVPPRASYSDMLQVSQPTVARTATLTVLAMLAFAANSLLCRAALRDSSIDPAGFTLLRLLAGALLLFGAVQATMLGYGFWRGERRSPGRRSAWCAPVAAWPGCSCPGCRRRPGMAHC